MAGAFPPGRDIQLTPRVLVKRSERDELVLNQMLPVHQVLVRVTDDEFKDFKSYDIEYFGTSKFGKEGVFGAAEKHLSSALSFYTLKTGYSTTLLRSGAALNVTLLENRKTSDYSHGVQYRKLVLSADAEAQLLKKTQHVIDEFPTYEECSRNANVFIDLAARYYWLARSVHQEHAAFLNHLIALEVLLSERPNIKTSIIRRRAALLLGKDDDEQQQLYKKLGRVYEARGKIIHAGYDVIEYDLLNFLEDSIPRVVKATIRLSREFGANGETTKSNICEKLDNAARSRALTQRIRELIHGHRPDS